MKLRILNNSIRLRLSQTEVKELSTRNEVRCETQFGTNGAIFSYMIRKTSEHRFQAKLENNSMLVLAPSQLVDTWAASDQVSLTGEQTIDDQSRLVILIEKDFKCLTDRPHEDESDLFPNPDEGKHC